MLSSACTSFRPWTFRVPLRCNRDVDAAAGKVDSPSAAVRVKLLLAENSHQLDLSDSRLTEIPESVFELTNLTDLSLSGNAIQSIPLEISQLTNLQRLQLSGNELQHLPDEIGALTELQGLWIHGNCLETIPKSFGNLLSLQKCSLSGNRLSFLPCSVSKLTSLEELEVAGNALTELPSLEGLEQLKRLVAHGNRIDHLTESILYCLRLCSLSLQGNELEKISAPYCLFPQALKSINLADNQLSVFQCDVQNLTNLETLTLYGNQLRSLPTGLMTLPRLKSLWLEGNPLDQTTLERVIAISPVQVGLDQKHQDRLNASTVQSSMVSFSQISYPYWSGYFKLVRENPDKQAEMLVVAFGSAPGTPNWAAVLRKIKQTAKSNDSDPMEASISVPSTDVDQHHDLSYDVLFVVDARRSWYGVGGADFDRYSTTLNSICESYTRCFMIGDSMGATAGLLFSTMATGVLAFCPQIHLNTASLRPAVSPQECARLAEKIEERIAQSTADIRVLTGTWTSDMDQVKDLDRTKISHVVLEVDTHRLTAYLERHKMLIPLVRDIIRQHKVSR